MEHRSHSRETVKSIAERKLHLVATAGDIGMLLIREYAWSCSSSNFNVVPIVAVFSAEKGDRSYKQRRKIGACEI